MASVKVAVRVRPFNQREIDMEAKLIIQMHGKKTRILKNKSSDQFKDFTFDHSYWSFNQSDLHFTSQEQVFGDLGKEVVDAAFEGYNACVFAYGQTGSGKTFTMTGSSDNQGLIPRICESLFGRMASGASYRTEVSYLEIYNERVKDLLRENSSGHNLRVREHPRSGPYVSDLSRHLVSEYAHIKELMARGNAVRTTASTNMNDTSSRSHAIFTLQFVQAGFSNDVPSETVSKIHLVDLAGSERADATGATGQRLKEGAHINKSLVTLGSVISALAELSSPGAESGGRRSVFIPYRDSVLTWLLKDSLGGNSKTIMIAAISPADCNYSETLSTLRYANRAKNIINKPTINEDPNVKLIKELRDEISKLKGLLCSEMTLENPQVLATLHKKEAQEKVLTEKWTEKWRETQKILQEQKALGLRKAGTGVVLDCDMPHLIGIDDNLLSTGVTLYHLKDGETVIGSEELQASGADGDLKLAKPDIVLSGADVERHHCSIVLTGGVATLYPHARALCWVNGCQIDRPTRLSQGCQILLGRNNMFRYNDPVEAEKLRKEGKHSSLNLSRLSLLSWSTTDLTQSSENLQSSCCEDANKEIFHSQKAELQKEKDAFKLEQAEKEQDWEKEQQMKREALEQAQRQLELERQQMEVVYSEQCRRLAEDWRQLERQQEDSEAALRIREAELDKRRRLLQCERDEELAAMNSELKAVSEAHQQVASKKKEFIDFVTRKLQETLFLNNNSLMMHEESGNFKPLSVLAAEKFCECLCWMDLTIPTHEALSSDTSPLYSPHSPQSWVSLASALKEGIIGEIVNHHKESITKLESEIRSRVKSVAEREEKIKSIDRELQKQRENELSSADNDSVNKNVLWMDLSSPSNPSLTSPQAAAPFYDIASSTPKAKHSESEINKITTLKEENCHDLSNSGEKNDFFQRKKLSLDLVPAMTSSPETFHTVLSPTSSPPAMSDSGVGLNQRWDDSDDISSNDDSTRHNSHQSYQLHLIFDDKNARSKEKRTDHENISRVMKHLMQKITKQRLHIVRSLESDLNNIDTNQEISLLQELKREYVRLEKKLEGRGKENVESCEESDDTSVSAEESASMCGTIKYNSNKHISHRRSSLFTTARDFTPFCCSSQDVSCHRPSLQNRLQSPLSPIMNLSVSNQFMDHLPPFNFCAARSMPALNRTVGWEEVEEGIVVQVPAYVLRGAGSSTHYAYEVRVSAAGEKWALLRRYSRFRELHLQMKQKYGAKVAALSFPPRRLFARQAEWLARERRPQLEKYLRALLQVVSQIPTSPIHSESSKAALLELSPFFRRGVFESSKYGTS